MPESKSTSLLEPTLCFDIVLPADRYSVLTICRHYRAKPKSLFAQASAKKIGNENAIGARKTAANSDDPF